MAATQPALFARLQATIPDESKLHPNEEVSPEGILSRGLRSVPHPFPARATEPVKPPGGHKFAAILDVLAIHRRLLAFCALVGGLIFFCAAQAVPLYKIQASLAVETRTGAFPLETTLRVLKSKSLIDAALATLTPSEQAALIEPPHLWRFGQRDYQRALLDRFDPVVIPAAQVIDLQFITPDRRAGDHFVNALIQSLLQRTREEKLLLTSADAGTDFANSPDLGIANISIIDAAFASNDSVSPQPFLQLVLGALIGGLVGAFFVMTRKFAANTFAGPGSIGHVLGVRELGAMPERKLLGAAGMEVTATAEDCNNESLRYLRSSLLYHPGLHHPGKARCLAFTSAAPGEGKTTVVSNLSMSLAGTGRRVLVIDGDLRRPRLYKLLQVAPGPGLADLLRRSPSSPPALLSRFVMPTSFQNLYVLPPGTAGNDAPELLAGETLPQLLRELSKSFDFVLIDTPPLLACADARNYARAADGVVLIVHASETQKRAALVARDMILQDGSTIIGTVLTGWRQPYPSYSYPSAAHLDGLDRSAMTYA